MRPRSRLILAALAAAPLSARAGEFAQAPPMPGMALTLPEPGMANGAPALPPPAAVPPVPVVPQADLTGGRRRPRVLGGGFRSVDGQLPNQRTGPKHEHVVHDICIGC
ncbi:hypothetical protein [Methylobacterium sp. J-070]|uniref:hypothetical protein n=1 Tax=Methylobacterium sp. J-070 TaxID=2836650 RepID=UPI001FB8A567|nr:hypothetical protein [Methylobacterium sp. J-070]MCJ2052554.1 hypothetical protein [Methylobacterium sp. J-070]